MSDNNATSTSGTERILNRLQSDDVALKLTHGEGYAYYAWVGGELHHHREHHRAESCDPGDESLERLRIDVQNLSLFEPEFIPLAQSPINRNVGAGTDRSEGETDE